MNHFGDEYAGRKVVYVKQKKPLGTAHALSLCERHLRGRFLVLMGDDIYSREDIAACLTHKWAWLVQKVRGKFTGGRILYDEQHMVTQVEEGTHDVAHGYVGTNCFVLGMEYFAYPPVAIKDGAEFGLPQTVAAAARDHAITMVEARDWQQITDMDDVKRLHQKVHKRQKTMKNKCE